MYFCRYERGGNPLFISPTNKPTDIPNCSHCGGERQFEFQVRIKELM